MKYGLMNKDEGDSLNWLFPKDFDECLGLYEAIGNCADTARIVELARKPSGSKKGKSHRRREGCKDAKNERIKVAARPFASYTISYAKASTCSSH